MKEDRHFVRAVCSLVAIAVLASCSDPFKEKVAEASRLAKELDSRTVAIRESLLGVVSRARDILGRLDPKAPGLIPGREYILYKGTVYYNPKDDGNGAMFYTGFVPVGPMQRAKVLSLEAIIPAQRSFVESGATGGLISQTYLITADSLLVFYPYSELLSYIPPKRDMQSRGVWKKTSPEVDPGRGPVWDPPYVDTTGKGYMVDITCPVDVDGRMEAVVGADITLNALNSGFAGRSDLRLFLVETRNAQIIAMSKAAEEAFSVGNVEAFKYLRMIENSRLVTDAVLPDNLILAKTDSAPMREIWTGITAGKTDFGISLSGKQSKVHAEYLPETGWVLVLVE